ncbi:hypothetical protein [Cytobacillus praedii]|uniref:hypothetical protein n=1 Tax=Cytobacillus praedii TaxID=1742358 RepID=UPI002E1FE68E|nr:hypothetical protein [Cytobacillus praedii]
MDLLKSIDDWVQKGFGINYYLVDQFENGYGKEVLAGNIPKFTYTFFIEKGDEELWILSVDTLEDGFSSALVWLNKNYETK